MESAIIAGVFAFFGAVAGQILNRNTQRETWLLQKRAEVFSKFLVDFDEYDRECSRLNALQDYSDQKHEAMCLACDKINASENIVCFYLSEADKQEFRKLVNSRRYFEFDYTKLSDKSDPALYLKIVEPWHEINDAIQGLFERNLKEVSWYS